MNSKEDDIPSRPYIKACLKWFNGSKGFGFLSPEDRPDIDLFLHITVLQKAGLQTLGEGAQLLCETEKGDKGLHIKKILKIIDPGSSPVLETYEFSDGKTMEGSYEYEMCGIVKWYKKKEGFGFITVEDGQKDVFIHKSCLDGHNIDTLEAGQPVRIRFRVVPKGREAVFLELLS